MSDSRPLVLPYVRSHRRSFYGTGHDQYRQLNFYQRRAGFDDQLPGVSTGQRVPTATTYNHHYTAPLPPPHPPPPPPRSRDDAARARRRIVRPNVRDTDYKSTYLESFWCICSSCLSEHRAREAEEDRDKKSERRDDRRHPRFFWSDGELKVAPVDLYYNPLPPAHPSDRVVVSDRRLHRGAAYP